MTWPSLRLVKTGLPAFSFEIMYMMQMRARPTATAAMMMTAMSVPDEMPVETTTSVPSELYRWPGGAGISRKGLLALQAGVAFLTLVVVGLCAVVAVLVHKLRNRSRAYVRAMELDSDPFGLSDDF